MVKAAYVDKDGLKKGAWSEEEDNKLRSYIVRYGHWNWRLLPKFAGKTVKPFSLFFFLFLGEKHIRVYISNEFVVILGFNFQGCRDVERVAD